MQDRHHGVLTPGKSSKSRSVRNRIDRSQSPDLLCRRDKVRAADYYRLHQLGRALRMSDESATLMLVLLMVLFVLAGLEGMDARWEDPRPDRWRMRRLGMRGFGGVAGSPPSWSRRGGCGLGRKQVQQIALMADRGLQGGAGERQQVGRAEIQHCFVRRFIASCGQKTGAKHLLLGNRRRLFDLPRFARRQHSK